MKRSSLLMFLVCALTLLFGVAPLVQADWDPGDSHKMHYPQLPMIDGGWDVCLCCQWVADDFVCSKTGSITDIHFWVSFKEDMEFPLNDPAMWNITIRDDAGGMPGAIRWAFSGGKIVTKPYGGGAQGWLCPSPPPLAIPPFPIPDHYDVYQVNITDLLEPMIQQQDTTYWLVIRANLPWMPPPSVGWKQATSAHQYPAMYDSGTGWMPIFMATPDTQGIHDLAFVITGGEDELDFGDAPENTATGGPTQYPTKLVNDGARHVADGVNYLGQLEDVEPDGQPTLAADGDDINPVAADDEDGVTFVNGGLTAGVGEPVDVLVSPVGGPGGYLNVWIDYNADFDWDDAGEYVLVDQPVAGGMNNLTITAPAGSVVGPTYARFRYTTYPIAGILGYSGQASDGEIEDYRVEIMEEPEEEYTKWIQRPHGPEQGFDEQSNIWIHEDIPAMEVNKVVADDFVSDGRVIKKVRWWGSYFDDRYEPFIEPIEPWVVDGWIISFHHTQGIDGTNLACPPDIMAGSVHPTALGLYFAPAYAVEIMPMGYLDCHGHNVYGYKVDLSQCCLLCQEVDPRSGTTPAQIGAFCEEECFRYWLDIVAVVGATWEPIAGADCDMMYTGHLPSPDAADGRFWGWHTSPDACLKQACSGQIVDMTPPTPNCWDYGNWSKVMWQCPTPVQPPVNMSFELITPEEEPATCFVGTQAEFAVWCGWGQPANWCGDCWRQGDIDGDCAITFADVQMVYGDFLAPGSPGALSGRSDNDMDGAITFADVQKVYGAFLPPTVLCPVPCTPLP